MKIYFPDAPLVSLQLHKRLEIYKIIGPMPMMAVPHQGDSIQIPIGEDEIYIGVVKLVKWHLTFNDGDNVPMVTVYVAQKED